MLDWLATSAKFVPGAIKMVRAMRRRSRRRRYEIELGDVLARCPTWLVRLLLNEAPILEEWLTEALDRCAERLAPSIARRIVAEVYAMVIEEYQGEGPHVESSVIGRLRIEAAAQLMTELRRIHRLPELRVDLVFPIVTRA
jgi:hypothetical protein